MGIAQQAMKMPNAVLIPPVPPLMKTSDKSYALRVVSSNRVASIACKRLSERTEPIPGREIQRIFPYFHLCIDWAITKDRQGFDEDSVLHLLESELDHSRFSGVAVSISGYGTAAEKQSLSRIEHLVNEIVNISHESQVRLPVLLLRSGWFGLSLTDLEIQAFSSLFNGKPKYTVGGGGGNNENRFGKVPLIDECRELTYAEVKEYLRKHKEFPFVPGLPRRPSKEDLEKPELFRERYAKPMRLIHVEEARRVR